MLTGLVSDRGARTRSKDSLGEMGQDQPVRHDFISSLGSSAYEPEPKRSYASIHQRSSGCELKGAGESLSQYSRTDVPRTQEREQHQDTLAAASREAFQSFQSDISEHHEFIVVSKQLAVIDCLMSLAQVAAASGYCKPVFVAEPQLHIRQGRHPMVCLLTCPR